MSTQMTQEPENMQHKARYLDALSIESKSYRLLVWR
jgi:hypothetical protein